MSIEESSQTVSAALIKAAIKGTTAPTKPGTYLCMFLEKTKDDKQQDTERAVYDVSFYDTRTPAGWFSKTRGRATPAFWWPMLGAHTVHVLLKSK
jgi:hypothetical protein